MLPHEKFIYLGNKPFQTNYQILDITPVSADFLQEWQAEQEKKTGRKPGQSRLKFGKELTIQTDFTSVQPSQISDIIVLPMPDLEKQTSATGNNSFPDLLEDRVKGQRPYTQIQNSLSSFKPEDRPKVERLLDESLKNVQLQVQENIHSRLADIPENVRSVVSDFVNQTLEEARSAAKPTYEVESLLDESMMPIDEAAGRLGVSDRHVRRIIVDGNLETEKRKVIVTREMEIVFVPFKALVNYRQNHSIGRPRKDELHQFGLHSTHDVTNSLLPKNGIDFGVSKKEPQELGLSNTAKVTDPLLPKHGIDFRKKFD